MKSNLVTIVVLGALAFAGYKLLTDKGTKVCAQGGPQPTDALTHWSQEKCCWALDSTGNCYEGARFFFPQGYSPALTGYGPPPPSGVGLGWY